MSTKLQDDLARIKRLAKRAAMLGALLALACHAVPHEYRAACNAVAAICTGGF